MHYLKALLQQGRLVEVEESDRNRILRVKQIYESMKLRTNEIKDLKRWFSDAGIDIEKDDLRKMEPEDIIEVLEKFFDDYLSKKPDTYFGGIRTDKDLDFKVIGWQA